MTLAKFKYIIQDTSEDKTLDTIDVNVVVPFSIGRSIIIDEKIYEIIDLSPMTFMSKSMIQIVYVR